MANPYFRFKQFTIHHDRCAMKVTTDACLFGAWAATMLQEQKNFSNLLDIGTGTGLLAFMIAQKNAMRIDAVELDADAATQATSNAAASPWAERMHVLQEDVLHFDPTKKYDAIVSNPPFYEGELASRQQDRNRAHHSSNLSLVQVAQQVRARINTGGCFFLLLPYKRRQEVEMLLPQNGLYPTKIVTVKPSTLHAPFRLMIEGGLDAGTAPRSSQLCIRDEVQEYTTEFVELLKDYYLYL
jgi:tRNA1Val (adenine37-N6)-methyltransferase